MNKKQMISLIFGLSLLSGYFLIYSYNKKNPIIAESGSIAPKKINVESIQVCLNELKETVKSHNISIIEGKINDCILQSNLIFKQETGYELDSSTIKKPFFPKIFLLENNKTSKIKIKESGLRVVIDHNHQSFLSPCYMNVIDPVVEDHSLSFIANKEKNLIVCLKYKTDDFISYYSGDWGSEEVKKEIENRVSDLKKERTKVESLTK